MKSLKLKEFINENYYSINEDKKITATDFESVICYLWNQIYMNVPHRKNLKYSNITKPHISKIVRTQAEEYEEMIQDLKKHFDTRNISNVILRHNGTTIGELTPFWKQFGASNSTPKTDIYDDNESIFISLKKAKRSQLMSAQYEETKATFAAAFEDYKKNNKSDFDDAFKHLTDEKNWSFIALEDKGVTDLKNEIAKIGDFRAGGADRDEVQKVIGLLKSGTKEKEIAEQWLRNIDLNESLNQIAQSSDFLTYFVWEAISGRRKFLDPISKSSHILTFNEDTQTINMYDINEKYASQIAKKVQPEISFKSRLRGASVSLRLVLNEAKSEKSLLEQSFWDAYHIENGNEIVNESITGFFKDLGSKILDVARNIRDFVSRGIYLFFMRLNQQLKNILQEGWKIFEDVFGLEPSISIPEKINFDI
jgi:hypothetical protein